MAYTKIHAVTATVGKAVDYICNPDKTDGSILISSYGCSPQTAVYDFQFALSKTDPADPNKAYHLIQSFAPDECKNGLLNPEKAHQIGNGLAEKLLGNAYSYIVTTHIDKGHIHNHIIFCAADNIHHKKYHDCKQSYYHIRRLSDGLCMEHNLSVIPASDKKGKPYNEWQEYNKGSSWKAMLKTDINETIKNSLSYEEFILAMEAKGYEIQNQGFDIPGRYIKFRAQGQKHFIRGRNKTLGMDYTKERIKERIENKARERAGKMLHGKSIRCLINTSASQKYEENPGLKKWADKQNLKFAAQAYAALNEKGFQSLEELEEQVTILSGRAGYTKSSIISLERKMKEQALILKYAEQYTENKPYNMKYCKSKNKDAIFRKYETQLMLYDSAKNSLERMGLNPVKVNLEEVRKDYITMENERNMLSGSYKKQIKEVKELEHLKDTLFQYVNIPGKEQNKQKKQNIYDL
jgi:hypothetical protein